VLLDRQARDVLDWFATQPAPGAGWPAARAWYRATRAPLQPPPVAVEHVMPLVLEGAGGPIPLRHYRPLGTTSSDLLPAIVFFHGGGWTTGDLDTHDGICRALANAVRGIVVAVDYRLAPEHRFPAAFDDCVAATRWVADEALRLGIDRRHLVVAGDSAGGNLAAAVAIAARNGDGPPIAAQALVYPALDFRMKLPSHREFAEGYLLGAAQIRASAEAYLRGPEDVDDWRASPLLVPDVTGLPPAIIVTAGFDPLRDEGEAYAERLHAAGVPVTYECFEGMIHGFLQMGARVAAAPHAIYRVGQGVRIALGLARPPGARTR
jgi:acetyl esterase